MLTQTIILLNILIHSYCNNYINYVNMSPQGLRVINGDPDTVQLDFVVIIVAEKPFTVKNWRNGTSQVRERICSGSLLSLTWVLTAGHCCTSEAGKIRYGDTSGKNTKISRILRQIVHPKYVYLPQGAVINDIGLLQVEKILLPIRPGQLSAADYKSLIGYPMKIAGYGLTALKESEINFNSPLQLADVMAIKCPEGIGPGPNICVSPRCDKFQMTNKGDSGGPLLLDRKIVGVTSRRTYDLNVIYCPVTPYVTWIKRTIQKKL